MKSKRIVNLNPSVVRSYIETETCGIPLISNQLGYKNEAISGDTCFNEDGLYEINVS